MMRVACLLLAMIAAPALAGQFELRPDAPGQAFYRSALPPAVYQDAQRFPAAHWVVKNAAGEVVPHVVYTPAQTVQSTQAQERRATIFTLTPETLAAQQGAPLKVQLERLGNGKTTVQIHSGQGAATTTAATAPAVYLLDLGAKTAPTLGLTLQWQGGAGQMIGVEVLGSDDLKSFTPLGEATLLSLNQGAEKIIQNTVALNAISTQRYLQIRLTADSAANPALASFKLTQAKVRSAVPGAAQVATTLTEALTAPAVSKAGNQVFYDFTMLAKAAVHSLDITLPQMNTITPIRVFTRSGDAQPWALLAQKTVYKLRQNNAVVTSPALEFAPTQATQWRVAVDASSGGLGAASPSLAVFWVGQTLVWNARGEPPFKLHINPATPAPSTVFTLASLLPGLQGEDELVRISALPPAAVSGFEPSAAAQPVAKAVPAKPVGDERLKWLLWSGLGLGVLLLGGMAYSLLKPATTTPPKDAD